jgi:hypothetical protein
MSAVQTASSSPAGSDSGVVVVRTVGWTWFDRALQVLIVAMFPVGVAVVFFLATPPVPSKDLIPGLVGIMLFLVAVDVYAEAIISVRQVKLDSSGVTFSYIFHSEHRKWEDLEPSRLSPRHGGWGVKSRYRGGRLIRTRGYAITIEQARALVDYPNCPKWDLPPETLQALGISPARPE